MSTVDLLLVTAAVAALVAFLLLRRGQPGARSVDKTVRVDRAERSFRIEGGYRRLLRQAGLEPHSFWLFFWVMKLLLAALLPLALLQVVGNLDRRFVPAAVVLSALVGFFALDLWILSLRRERQRRIRYSLPYFLDLVVAFLRAGLGLEEAFRRAGREGFEPEHPLGREVVLVAREIDLGKDRSAAFHALAERTGVPAMKAVATALESGLRLGASVEATLRSQADLLRARRREDTLRRVQMAALKALLPVLLCGFPLFVVIVFYPTFREILRTLASLSGS